MSLWDIEKLRWAWACHHWYILAGVLGGYLVLMFVLDRWERG